MRAVARPTSTNRNPPLLAENNSYRLNPFLATLASIALLVAYLVFTFVGTNPFNHGGLEDRVSGNSTERLVLLALFSLGSVALIARPKLGIAVLWRSWAALAVFAVILGSLAWADYPSLSLRRAIAVTLVFGAAVGVTLVSKSPGQVLRLLVMVLLGVTTINLASLAVLPDKAWSELGAQGMHAQKNQAGLVAMVAIVASACLLLSAKSRLDVLIGAALLGSAGIFLVLTESKTSMGLTAAALVVALPVLAFWRLGGGFGAAVLAFILASLSGGMVVATGAGWGQAEIMEAIFGDPTFTGRTDIWEFVNTEIDEARWLGVGYGSYWDVGEENDPSLRAPPGNWMAETEVGLINQAHNGYLDLQLQIGLVGLIPAVWVAFRCLFQTIRLSLAPELPVRDRGFHMFCFLTITLFLLHNLMEASLFARGVVFATLSFLVILQVERWTLEREVALRNREKQAAVPLSDGSGFRQPLDDGRPSHRAAALRHHRRPVGTGTRNSAIGTAPAGEHTKLAANPARRLG